MRTTLDINERLLARAKAAAARERTTLTRLIEEGLALRLRGRAATGAPLPLPVFDGGSGLAPGIDPRRNRALLDATDDDGPDDEGDTGE